MILEIYKDYFLHPSIALKTGTQTRRKISANHKFISFYYAEVNIIIFTVVIFIQIKWNERNLGDMSRGAVE